MTLNENEKQTIEDWYNAVEEIGYGSFYPTIKNYFNEQETFETAARELFDDMLKAFNDVDRKADKRYQEILECRKVIIKTLYLALEAHLNPNKSKNVVDYLLREIGNRDALREMLLSDLQGLAKGD